jgi:FtsP/CotA-like multicopper oxidase with cupredoxin domain
MFGFIQVGGKDDVQSLDWVLPTKYHVTQDIPFAVWGPSLRYIGTASSFKMMNNNDGSTQPKKDVKSGVSELQLNSYLNNENMMGGTITPFLVNNGYQPTFQVTQGEVVRFRVLSAFVMLFMAFAIVPDTPGIDPLDPINQLNLYVIASDGIPYLSPKLKKRLVLASAQREEVLVRFDTPGRYLIRSDGVTDLTDTAGSPPSMINQNVTLAFVEVTPAMKPLKKKGKKPTIPKDITKWKFTNIPPRAELVPPKGYSSPAIKRRIEFSEMTPTDKSLMPTTLEVINGVTYRYNIVLTDVIAGSLEEWVLVSPKNGAIHVYHIHVNPFVVKSIVTDEYTEGMSLPANQQAIIQDQIGLWRDTITIPENGTVTIWVQFSAKDPLNNQPYTGKTVYHCHLEDHSDTGMIQNIVIRPLV